VYDWTDDNIKTPDMMELVH